MDHALAQAGVKHAVGYAARAAGNTLLCAIRHAMTAPTKSKILVFVTDAADDMDTNVLRELKAEADNAGITVVMPLIGCGTQAGGLAEKMRATGFDTFTVGTSSRHDFDDVGMPVIRSLLRTVSKEVQNVRRAG